MGLAHTLNHLVNHPLNKQNRVGALITYAKWQIGSRVLGKDVLHHWINDSVFVARSGETGVTGNIYCGLHEFPDMSFLLHVLREDDLFVDIGANVGSYTILACSAIGAKGYSFEPVPSTFKRLETNIHVNNISEKVIARNIALGNSEGEVFFSKDKNCTNHVIANDEDIKNKITVNISTLDSELNRSPFLIKLDVEGYELPALEGAERTLASDELCSVIVELNGSANRYDFDESKILQLLFDNNFNTYTYDPFNRNLISLEGKNLTQGNTLFIKNVDRVLGRLKSAKNINIHGLSI